VIGTRSAVKGDAIATGRKSSASGPVAPGNGAGLPPSASTRGDLAGSWNIRPSFPDIQTRSACRPGDPLGRAPEKCNSARMSSGFHARKPSLAQIESPHRCGRVTFSQSFAAGLCCGPPVSASRRFSSLRTGSLPGRMSSDRGLPSDLTGGRRCAGPFRPVVFIREERAPVCVSFGALSPCENQTSDSRANRAGARGITQIFKTRGVCIVRRSGKSKTCRGHFHPPESPEHKTLLSGMQHGKWKSSDNCQLTTAQLTTANWQTATSNLAAPRQ